jgi:GT2 family glycosyltransferase
MGDNGKFRVNPLPSGFDVQKMDQLCERSALHTVLFVPLVNGFCLALRKDVLEEVGYFDEQSFPTGYGEEDDLCLRIAEAGYACGISTDSFVFHTKSATFTPERRDLLVAAGRKELERKHGAASLEAASSTLRNNPGLREMRQRLRSALEV